MALRNSREDREQDKFASDSDGNTVIRTIISDNTTNPTDMTISVGSDKRTQAYEDTSFVTGDSPVTHDVNFDLGRDGIDGYIVNDGEGNIIVEISNDGASYGSQHTMKKGDVLSLTGMTTNLLRLTWVSDSAYRILVI